jgi:hypothetical protein
VPFGHTGQKTFCIGWDPTPSTHKLKNQAGHLFYFILFISFYFSCIFPYPPLQKEKLGMRLGFTFFFPFKGSQFDPKFKVRLRVGFVSMLGKFFLHT